MPTKQTKESIKAEVNASDVERIALQLQEVARDAELVEKDLRALEDELGIPEFARSLPLPERMAAVGMSRAGIERLSTRLREKRTCRFGGRRIVRRRAAGRDCRPGTQELIDQATLVSAAMARISLHHDSPQIPRAPAAS